MTNQKRAPLVVGMRVQISPRVQAVVRPIYDLKQNDIYQVVDVLYGNGGRKLYELFGKTNAGNGVTFVLAPKMLLRVKGVLANSKVVAQNLAATYHRPESQFRAIAAIHSMPRKVRVAESGLVVAGH